MPKIKALTKNSSTLQKAKIPKPRLINFSQRFITLGTQAKTKSEFFRSNIPRKNKAPISLISQAKIPHQADLPPSILEFSPAPTQALGSQIDDSIIVAQAQAGLIGFDEINKLIKKLALSFSSKKSESSFFIKTGIFEGARFQIRCHQKDLHLKVNNLAANAHQILSMHQDYLRMRLNRKEINLASVVFNS